MKSILKKEEQQRIILNRGTLGGTTSVSEELFLLQTNQDELILTNFDEVVYSK